VKVLSTMTRKRVIARAKRNKDRLHKMSMLSSPNDDSEESNSESEE
jgi:hypothetical protein